MFILLFKSQLQTTPGAVLLAIRMQILSIMMALAIYAPFVEGICSMAHVRNHTNICLHDNMVAHGTEFLVPVLQDPAAVVNFCTRAIMDIKVCIQSLISACASDNIIQVILGTSGAALAAAYDGICSEAQKDTVLTCAYQNYADEISVAVQLLVTKADDIESHLEKRANICHPFNAMHGYIMSIFDKAIASNDCTEHSKSVMNVFLSTILFPCNDVATSYYPCTLERFNADAIDICYLRKGVRVRNSIIPTPDTLTHADEFCSAKGLIQSCMKTLINRCLYEQQVTTLFGLSAAAFSAGLDCMCDRDKSGMTLSCAEKADVTSAMALFTESVHNHSVAGTLDKATQCKLEVVMKNDIANALGDVCTSSKMRQYWLTYVDTVVYPCTKLDTTCYPRTYYNGAQSNESLRRMLLNICVAVNLISLFATVY